MVQFFVCFLYFANLMHLMHFFKAIFWHGPNLDARQRKIEPTGPLACQPHPLLLTLNIKVTPSFSPASLPAPLPSPFLSSQICHNRVSKLFKKWRGWSSCPSFRPSTLVILHILLQNGIFLSGQRDSLLYITHSISFKDPMKA